MTTEQNNETNEVTVQSARPIRKNKKLLDPNWFQETCKLAIKHGTNLIFTEDRVWGVSVRNCSSVWAEYPANLEWCEEITRALDNDKELAQFATPMDNSALKLYAKIALDSTSECYIDETTLVVHMLGAGGIELKSGCFMTSCFSEAPDLPAEPLTDFVYRDAVPKDVHEILVSSVSNNQTRRPIMCRVFPQEIDGVNGLVATDGRSLVQYIPEIELPEMFNFSPKMIDANKIVGFQYGLDKNDSPTNRYMLSDGVMITHTLAVVPKGVDGVPFVVQSAFKQGAKGMVSGDFLKQCFGEVAKLGIGGKCKTQTFVFTNGHIDFNTETGTLISFDGEVELPEGVSVTFDYNLKVLRHFAKSGRTLKLNEDNPSVYRDEQMTFLIMPMRVSK